jgi:uncharacterized protein
VLANYGERNRDARVAALIVSGTLAGLGLVVGLWITVLNLLQYSTRVEGADQLRTALLLGVPLTVAGALGLLYLWHRLQRAVARLIPLRPDSPVVHLTVVLGLLLVAPQIGARVEAGKPLTIGDLLAQDIPLLMLCFVGIGVFVRRTPREAIERLGLLPPRQKRWWLVAILGVGLFMAVAFAIETVANVVAPSQQKQVSDVTTVLFSHFNNPAAVIFLGVLAGVVEETLFRGALVPRFGVIISAILFAALHTQYAVSFATLEVFVLGVGLGWLRVRSGSTLPSMVTHAGYDIAVGFLSLMAK